MSELEDKSVPVEELVDGAEEQVDQGQPIPAVTVRLPTPVNSRTLPKGDKNEFTSITFHPQASDTVQELKLSINEWVGGYWLGPYSLRIPRQAGEAASKGSVITADGGVTVPAAVGPGEKLSEWLETKDVFEGYGEQERILEVVREPYSDFSARQTVLRVLELITPAGSTTHHTSNPLGLIPGATIFEAVRDGQTAIAGETMYEEVEVSLPSGKKGKQGKKEVVKVKRELASAENPFSDWKTTEWVSAPTSQLPLSQPPLEAQSCVKSIQVSPFNPPPPHLKQQGHQLYLTVSILEGDVYTLVCASRGWYVSKSNVNVFDPTPRSDGFTHSLVDLLHSISPLFSERLALLAPLSQEAPKSEPIATVPVPQYEPAYSFLAPTPKSVPAEPLRSQMAYLHTGATTADALDAARDWNEELQNVRELPRDSMQERVLREKMAQKTWAEFNAASIRVIMAIARGDIPPLNPNEDARGHMWLMSNIFITRAIDCIDTYAHVGGDAAAHISHAKDAAMVKLLNKTDIDGLYLLGHTVIDWQGERWVCQSVLPGIFSRKLGEKEEEEGKEDWVKVGESAPAEEPELAENPLIVYGLDSEVTSTVHWDAGSHKLMSKLATALRLAPHHIQDGKGAEHEFFASAEVKALKGTDGRRYLLDLPRLMPVDVEFLQKDLEGALVGTEDKGEAYPHRVVLLRPELLELFFDSEFKRWARKLAAEHQPKEAKEEDAGAETGVTPASAEDANPAAEAAAAAKAEQEQPLDMAAFGEKIKQFDLRFNPDAFVDMPHPRSVAVEEQEQAYIPSTITDESEPAIKAVRDASVFLRTMSIPALTLDVMMGNITGMADGASLTRAMHARGINMRYLGHLAQSIQQFTDSDLKGHLASFSAIVQKEMILRAAKHVLRSILKGLAPEYVPCAISHFLNCLLGAELTEAPKAVYQPLGLGDEPEPAYVSLTVASVRERIVAEVGKRFRYALSVNTVRDVRKKQLMRELAMRCGFQLAQRDYAFTAGEQVAETEDKKKDKKAKKVVPRTTTFAPEDVLTLVPVVKTTAPTASVAEEVVDAGRTTIDRGDIFLGLEIMLEGVQFYEQIHSVIHPEVAMVYNHYASTLYQIARLKVQQNQAAAAAAAQAAATAGDAEAQAKAQGEAQAIAEKPLGLDMSTAVRLQKQAIIIAERTLGVYHADTANYYFNLAMLENLEGNAQQGLRYFRHCLLLWDVIYGEGHPEVNTVLSNAGVVLQSMNENALSLALLTQVQQSTEKLFGASHLSNGHALHQLTQGLFLQGDIAKALTVSQAAHDIFTARLGADHAQTKEVGKNVDLLRAVVENMERQKEMTQRAKEQQAERLRAAQARVAHATGSSAGPQVGSVSAAIAAARRRVNSGQAAGTGIKVGGTSTGEGTAAGAAADAAAEEASRIGERGHMDVDELVKFIQGGQQAPKRSAKNSLRGKRRTGAKR